MSPANAISSCKFSGEIKDNLFLHGSGWVTFRRILYQTENEEIHDLCLSSSHDFNSYMKNHDECYIFSGK